MMTQRKLSDERNKEYSKATRWDKLLQPHLQKIGLEKPHTRDYLGWFCYAGMLPFNAEMASENEDRCPYCGVDMGEYESYRRYEMC